MRKILSLLTAILFAGSLMATSVTKTIEELAVANSWGNGTVVTPFALDEVITVSKDATDANSGKYYTAGHQIRLYQTGAATITLTAAEGYAISSVKLTYASQNTGILLEAASGTAVPFENVQSATFTVGNSGTATNGQVRLTAFEVEYAATGGTTPVTPATTKTLYLTLSSDWAGWPAKYAMYYFKSANNSQNGWSTFMSEVPAEENTYVGTIPADYDKVIFARFNSDATAPAWDSNKWSQTVDLSVPTDDKDLFTVTSGGTGNECNGAWSKHGTAPEPVDSMTVYFFNNLDWTSVNAFVWPAQGNSFKAWPGEAAKKEAEQIHGKDVYAYTFPASYVNVIFNNGTVQTADLAWVAAKPYFVPGATNAQGQFEGTWYAKNEIPEPVADTTATEECNGKYGIMLNNVFVPAAKNEAQTEWLEYAIEGIELAEGDKFQLYDSCNAAAWIVNAAYHHEGYAFAIDTVGGAKWEVTMAGTYNLYIKLIPNADELYVINTTYVPDTTATEECNGKYGIMLNNVFVPAAKNEAQTEWLEYAIEGIELAEGDKFQLYDSCNAAAWIVNAAYHHEGYAFNVVEDKWEVTMAGTYNLYIKLIPNADELYVINTTYVPDTTVVTVEDGFYLVGTLNEWTAAAEYKFVANEGAAGEYLLVATLAEGDELKVKKVEAGQADVWYPAEGGNYVVDAAHAGAKTIYFRPEYNAEWAAFGGYMYIPGQGEGVENIDADTKVVKQMINGSLFIIRGEKTYTIQGQLVR